jgi:hypothetical protein
VAINKKRGYYVEPIVSGLLEKTRKPFLCAMDMIGAQSFSKLFVCSGVVSKAFYGTAEALPFAVALSKGQSDIAKGFHCMYGSNEIP